MGELTSEILEVYNFITSILGADCAGEKDLTYLTLRVCVGTSAFLDIFTLRTQMILFYYNLQSSGDWKHGRGYGGS